LDSSNRKTKKSKNVGIDDESDLSIALKKKPKKATSSKGE